MIANSLHELATGLQLEQTETDAINVAATVSSSYTHVCEGQPAWLTGVEPIHNNH